jgi:hypothetical protein
VFFLRESERRRHHHHHHQHRLHRDVLARFFGALTKNQFFFTTLDSTRRQEE